MAAKGFCRGSTSLLLRLLKRARSRLGGCQQTESSSGPAADTSPPQQAHGDGDRSPGAASRAGAALQAAAGRSSKNLVAIIIISEAIRVPRTGGERGGAASPSGARLPAGRPLRAVGAAWGGRGRKGLQDRPSLAGTEPPAGPAGPLQPFGCRGKGAEAGPEEPRPGSFPPGTAWRGGSAAPRPVRAGNKEPPPRHPHNHPPAGCRAARR